MGARCGGGVHTFNHRTWKGEAVSLYNEFQAVSEHSETLSTKKKKKKIISVKNT